MSRIQSDYIPRYPQQPIYRKNCPVNFTYQTINNDPYAPKVDWERTPITGTSIKNLYTGIPNFYPLQYHWTPVGTMYDKDFSQFAIPGVKNPPAVSQEILDALGVDGVRLNYGWKPYPFTDRVLNETVPYSDQVLPYMAYRNWVKTPYVNDNDLNGYFEVPNPKYWG